MSISVTFGLFGSIFWSFIEYEFQIIRNIAGRKKLVNGAASILHIKQ